MMRKKSDIPEWMTKGNTTLVKRDHTKKKKKKKRNLPNIYRRVDLGKY